MWDVSKVTDMSWMFAYAYDFDQDLSSWETYSVGDMSYMFYYAESFNHGISMWSSRMLAPILASIDITYVLIIP